MSVEEPVDLTKHLQPATPDEGSIIPVEINRTDPERTGLIRQLGRKAYEWWESEDRPGLFELHYLYLPTWIASAVVVGGIGVATSDEVLGTHFADDMAQVQVMKHSNAFFRTVEEAVQDIGKAAGGKAQKQK